MKITSETMAIPADYPELALLVWNRDAAQPMSASEAFSVYERNWRFVDPQQLSEHEADFIRDLTRVFGNGVMLAS